MSGRVSVGELNARLKLDIPPSDDEATIAGVVIDRLGHVPERRRDASRWTGVR